MTSSRCALSPRGLRALAPALLWSLGLAQDPEPEGARAPFADVEAAARVLVEAATPRDVRREAAVELLFRFGAEGIERASLALQWVDALPIERELLGTVEGQVLEAVRDALEVRAAGGVDLDPAMLRLAPQLVRLASRREGARGRVRSDAAVRCLRALLESNLEQELRRSFEGFLRASAAPEMRRAMLIALPRLRRVELAPSVAAIAFDGGETAPLRRLAHEALVGLAQRGFASLEEFQRWSQTEIPSGLAAQERAGPLAWAAGERLRAELLIAREKLVTHAGGDLDLLLELLADPTFPRVRAGAARELSKVVAGFAPERDAEALRRVMSGLERGARGELHPEVLVEIAICLRNLAPLVDAAERSVERARRDAERLERCEQFRLHIKPLRELLIDLAPSTKVAERSQWAVRAGVVEALRWFPDDALVQSHVVELLEKALQAPQDASMERGTEYADYRRTLLRTAAEIDFAGPPAERALEQIRRLVLDPEVELRRSALPFLRRLGSNTAVGSSVRDTLLVLAREERDPGVRGEVLEVISHVAEGVSQFQDAALERLFAALSDEDRAVRELAAEWFVRALRSSTWSAIAAERFGPALEERLRPGAEDDPRVRAALARAALEGLREDWLRIVLPHLSLEELRAAARRMRAVLAERELETSALFSLATALGERLPEVAFSLLVPDPRLPDGVELASTREARDRRLLQLAWEAYARLERFSALPPVLSNAVAERLKALLERIDPLPALESEILARIDLELRIAEPERLLRELPPLLEKLPVERRGLLLDRLIWANWRVLRWTEVARCAAQREREAGRSESWCVAAMIFEAQLARDRAEVRASVAEHVREAQRLIADERSGPVDALLGVRRSLSLIRAFERQELFDEARALLAVLQPVIALPADAERELAALRASYR
ncbi:MAG: hypothetical protein IPN34_02340 [Planctomycetes bacterium]|nr:hypothetical protein [Planctomycetota bacterium]